MDTSLKTEEERPDERHASERRSGERRGQEGRRSQSRTAALLYPRADWERIEKALRALDFDADDPDAPDFPMTLARIIERETACWDNAEAPEPIVWDARQKKQIELVARSLNIEEIDS